MNTLFCETCVLYVLQLKCYFFLVLANYFTDLVNYDWFLPSQCCGRSTLPLLWLLARDMYVRAETWLSVSYTEWLYHFFHVSCWELLKKVGLDRESYENCSLSAQLLWLFYLFWGWIYTLALVDLVVAVFSTQWKHCFSYTAQHFLPLAFVHSRYKIAQFRESEM